MNPETGINIELSGELQGHGPESGNSDPTLPDLDARDYADYFNVLRVTRSEEKDFAVYTRSKRLSSRCISRIGYLNKLPNDSDVLVNTDKAVNPDGDAVVGGGDVLNIGIADGSIGNSGVQGGDRENEMMEIAVKVEPMIRRLTRSVFKMDDDSETENGTLRDVVILEADGFGSENSTVVSSAEARKIEMKMSKKILHNGRPTTVRELFETGLLEGYPVVYNGGKRGFPLRGTIKDTGILCSCRLCNGNQVVRPCQFEIHASKSYRRASQYICMENGKSLLDVVKECRKSTLKTLEETIRNIVGPLPLKEPTICSNCNKPFHATSVAKMEQLCDSCVVILNSDFDTQGELSRPLEPLLGLGMSDNGEVDNTQKKRGFILHGRTKRKQSELRNHAASPGKSSLHAIMKNKQRKFLKQLSKSASVVKSSESTSMGCYDLTSHGRTSMHGSMKDKCTRTFMKKSLSRSLKAGSPFGSIQSKSSSRITKKDQRMHKLVFENGGLSDGTEVAYYSNGKLLRYGYKMGSGIICCCCSTLVSPSQFEAHAGRASRRKPYMYIYTSNGVSLHEFAISLLKGRRFSSKDNDDLCIICADGGKLVLCDGCPRAFHKECASLSSIPRGKWYCTYCQNVFQRERYVEWNANAVAAGRGFCVDSIKQIGNRCTRHVKSPEEAEVIACVICRGYDFSKTGFGPRTVILCDQCEKEYHVGCLKKYKMADLKELPEGKWFCSENCEWICSALHNLLNSDAKKLPDSSLEIMKKKWTENTSLADGDIDVRWRLLNGKVTSGETRALLSQAVAIFHDSFEPIVDSETGRDFIPALVYGRNIRDRDFSGMYCAILMVNSVVVSAGILRIFGQEVAELPLAATRSENQGKGYFKLLYSCIEKLLAFFNVKSLVLPATDDAKSIWTEKFGFGTIAQEQLSSYKKLCWQMVAFEGTSMLEKAVPKCRIIKDADMSDSDIPVL